MNSRVQLKILMCKIVKCSETINRRSVEMCQVFQSWLEASPPQTGRAAAVTKCQNDLGCILIQAVFAEGSVFFILQAVSNSNELC